MKPSLSKKVYKVVEQADLNKPLALRAASFDLITCVGVTTYLNPGAIKDWHWHALPQLCYNFV